MRKMVRINVVILIISTEKQLTSLICIQSVLSSDSAFFHPTPFIKMNSNQSGLVVVIRKLTKVS